MNPSNFTVQEWFWPVVVALSAFLLIVLLYALRHKLGLVRRPTLPSSYNGLPLVATLTDGRTVYSDLPVTQVTPSRVELGKSYVEANGKISVSIRGGRGQVVVIDKRGRVVSIGGSTSISNSTIRPD